MSNVLARFADVIQREFLPKYCQAREYSPLGFKSDSLSRINAEDALNFLRAIDGRLATFGDNGRFTLPQSKASEVLFWEGWKSKTPRSITVWSEPIITLASIARLHYDFGWPLELLGTQPRSWAFDLSASRRDALDSEHVLGEVKKSLREVEVLLNHMQEFCASETPREPAVGDPRRNAYKKWLYLRDGKAALFWAVGPNAKDTLFKVNRSERGRVSLEKVASELLHFHNAA